MIDPNSWAENVSRPIILNDRRHSVAFAIDPEPMLKLPTDIAPICDPVKIREPLGSYTPTIFGTPSGIDSETEVPSEPAEFSDPYLYPTLTNNEYLRLSVLWYYTKGLTEDEVTIKKLNHILDIVKNTLGWEIAIVGMVDAATYSRFVTRDISLAVIPRRESTCSHTVNIQPGTVLSILDMSKDWRFKGSPAVENGGLRSYAGAQLRLNVSGGESVVLGSLCIASKSVRENLTRIQKETLMRAADMVVNELVMRTKLLRLREKQFMMESLTYLRTANEGADLDDALFKALTKHFPGCQTTFATVDEHTVSLDGCDGIPLSDFVHGSWEDSEHIRACALDQGNFESRCGRPVRALIGHIKPDEQVILVHTTEPRYVFDDIDTWFIEQCAQIYGVALQSRALKEALAAKERFLRTITHELRTPIHGILSSVELMMAGYEGFDNEIGTPRTQETNASQNMVLQNIKRSGVQLMTTVNNILRLNSSTHDANNLFPTDYDLFNIENDVLGEVLANYNEDQLSGLSLRFEYHLEDGNSIVHVDADLLKELLKCLIFNAVAATPSGTIRVCATSDADAGMQFDVFDTGHGIAAIDHERIFLPFEKTSLLSKGSGLGLSLATQMACALKGKVNLITSNPGQGSHFRVCIPSISASSTTSNLGNIVKRRPQNTLKILDKYHVIRHSDRDEHLMDHFEHHLQERGICKSDSPTDSLILMNMPTLSTDTPSFQLAELDSAHTVILVSSTTAEDPDKKSWAANFEQHQVLMLAGPFHTSRLDETLADISASVKDNKQNLPTLARIPTKLSATSDMLGPIITTPPATPCRELEALDVDDSKSRALRALLVDDNSVNLSVLQLYCKKRRIPHGTAVNGRLAFDAYRGTSPGERYSLILLDLQMPVCDGVESCRLIRAYEQQNGLEPAIIIMITGQSSVTDRKNSFGAGVDDFFVKPVSLKKLDQTIQRYFDASKT